MFFDQGLQRDPLQCFLGGLITAQQDISDRASLMLGRATDDFDDLLYENIFGWPRQCNSFRLCGFKQNTAPNKLIDEIS